MNRADRQSTLEGIFEAHYEAVMRYALRRTRHLADAEEVAAETFVVAWRHLADLPARDERLYWLYGIARRVLANHHRGETRRSRLFERVTAARSAGEHTASSALPDVLSAMSRLSADDQEILRLTAWEGLSHAEIGGVLSITPNAAGIRLHRARTRLAGEMSSPPGDVKGFHPIRTFARWKGSASRRSPGEEAP